MKISIKILCLLLFNVIVLHSQVLRFSNSAENITKKIFNENKIVFTANTDSFYTYAELKNEVGSEEVYYELYKVSPDNKENFDKTIYCEVKKSDKVITHKIEMLNPGRFKVYLFTGEGLALASGLLIIEKR